jgi:transcriptional regulator with XRE-family HTH domain
VEIVASGNEIREFLTTRRARITPGQAGLRTYGGRRRVAGLRREEVALLAGISVEYYIQLERGNVRGVSEDVLESVARSLQLDEVERTHLFDLVRAAKRRPAKAKPVTQRVRPGVQLLLDSMTKAAAFVRNGRLDILAANRLGFALYSEALANPERPRTWAVSSSSTVNRDASTRTGTASPTPPSGTYAPRPGVTRTTATSPISSASSRCGARSSGSAGLPTTSGSTAPAPSRSATCWSAT